MKYKVLLIATTLMIGGGLSATSHAQVPAIDPHALGTEAANLQSSVKELSQTVKHMEESILSLTDLGSLLDGLLDVNKLFPSSKPKLSSTPKKAIPLETASSSNPVDQVTSAVGGLLGGNSDKENKFSDPKTVSEAIKNNMQMVEEDESSVCGAGVMGAVGSLAGGMGGLGGGLGGMAGSLLGGGDSGLQGTNALQKRKQTGISKQMFAHYALATALVNQTLDGRTLSGSQKKTQQTVNKAKNQRQVHTAKTAGDELMNDTYNRLLFSQAVSNAMNAFKAMDQTEGKIAIGFSTPDIGSMGGLGALGDIAGKLF